jgi:hypothetical protein
MRSILRLARLPTRSYPTFPAPVENRICYTENRICYADNRKCSVQNTPVSRLPCRFYTSEAVAVPEEDQKSVRVAIVGAPNSGVYR